MNIQSFIPRTCRGHGIHRLFHKISFSTKTEHSLEREWKATIGLEIHAQISTESKLFSSSCTDFAKPVNSNVSLFDCAIPGTLPVLNKKCVEAGILTALALSCDINHVSMFERKHYFYPDLPAGYQITQHKLPFASNGEIEFPVFSLGTNKQPYIKKSKIKQIQLEQDSGNSLVDELNGRNLINLNRAGIPLMEFVFEPDLSDEEEAAALVKELILTLRLLQTCSCKMEEGALRVDANVSINQENGDLGVRTELKNISSTRNIASAIKYEIDRQIKVLKSGRKVVNETRNWDAHAKKTILLREKEDRMDYRFMPETNLPFLKIHVDHSKNNVDDLIDATIICKKIPVLPKEIRHKLLNTYLLNFHHAVALMNHEKLLKLFLKAIDINEKIEYRNTKMVAHFLVTNILTFIYKKKLENSFCEEYSDQIIEIIKLLQCGQINLYISDKILEKLITEQCKSPQQIIEENDWTIINDEEKLKAVCITVIGKYPKLVQKYKKGKTKVFSFLINEAINITDQRADASIVKIMKELLK